MLPRHPHRTSFASHPPLMRFAAAPALAVAFATCLAAQDPAPPPPPPAPTATLTLLAFTGYAHPDPEAIERNPDGTVPSCRGSLHFFVRFGAPGELHLALSRLEGAPATKLVTTFSPHPGPEAATTTVDALAQGETDVTPLGTFAVAAPGYHRITLATGDGAPLTQLHSLILTGPAAAAAHAPTRERRNAASVHLGYPVAAAHEDDIEWFYCEITPRTDPLWTYYMATGWHRGYFGMQVNSPTERRLIFSVWDAGDEAIDRAKVAAENRVQLVAKGENVVADSFGNEGTGGHSHLVHDWQLGETFRFLVHAAAEGTHTTYTGWFWFATKNEWGLIASFRAPKDGKRLRGLYSFNENFHGANGDLRRDCEFGNVWARTTKGEWLPLREAKFTHDGHGGRQRFDRHAGVRGDRFYLQNGGFEALPEGAVNRAQAALRVEGTGAHPDDGSLPQPPTATTPK